MLKVNSVSFRGTETRTISNNVTEPKNDVQADKKMSTKTKVMLGTSLAALTAVGIYIATKGKKGDNEVVNQVKDQVNKIKEYTIEAFKKEGKFEKGKAQLANGEMFTGTITGTNKAGNYVMEYENGLLKSSIIKNGEDVVVKKNYLYDENGLKEITNGEGKKIFEKTVDKEKGWLSVTTDKGYYCKDLSTGKILSDKDFRYYYRSDGTLKYTKAHLGDVTLFHTDGKTPEMVVTSRTCNEATFYDTNAKKLFEYERLGNIGSSGFKITYPDGNVVKYNECCSPVNPNRRGEMFEIGERHHGQTSYGRYFTIDSEGNKVLDEEFVDFLDNKLSYDFKTGQYTAHETITEEMQKLIDTDAAKDVKKKLEQLQDLASKSQQRINESSTEILNAKSNYLT